MTIYVSSKSMPYVYIGTHKITNEYYIGYRCKNVYYNRPSHLDLGVKYFTSSKFIQNRFHDFEWLILAEFFSKEYALLFEQNLILENFKDPLILNKSYRIPNIKFKIQCHSEETKTKIREKAIGRKVSIETREKRRKSLRGRKRNFTEKWKTNLSNAGCKFNYKLIDPEGNEYTTNNLSKFCSDFQLNNSAMNKLSRNVYKSDLYKGWRCTRYLI